MDDAWFKRELQSLCERAVYYPRNDEADARLEAEIMKLIHYWYDMGGKITDHNGDAIDDADKITLFIQRDKYEVSVKAFKQA